MVYANSLDPDQNPPSLIKVYTVCHFTKYFKERLNKKETLGSISIEWFEILG